MSDDRAFDPENGNGQQFFPSDVRVVSRAPGYEGDELYVDTDDLMAVIKRSKFREEQLSPGGVFTQMLNPATAVGPSPSGGTMLIDHDLSFVAHSIQVSNPTSQWLWIDGADQYVAPYMLNAVFAVGRGGSQKGVVLQKTPPGFTAAAAVTGEIATVTWHEASLRPSAGVIVNPSTVGGGLAVTDMGLKAMVPQGATPLATTSGNVGNAQAQCSLGPGPTGTTTYIVGFTVTYSGSTAGGPVVIMTVSPIGPVPSSFTLRYIISAPAGVAVMGTPLLKTFGEGVAADGPNKPIVLTLPALGSGNTNAVINAYGYAI